MVLMAERDHPGDWAVVPELLEGGLGSVMNQLRGRALGRLITIRHAVHTILISCYLLLR